MKKIYYIECGILLDKDDKEFDCYNMVFDKKHGFYDEFIDFAENLESAKKICDDYVNNGVNNTYGIITETYGKDDLKDYEDYVDYFVGDTIIYDIHNVVYNKRKNGNVIEEFLEF